VKAFSIGDKTMVFHVKVDFFVRCIKNPENQLLRIIHSGIAAAAKSYIPGHTQYVILPKVIFSLR
jgi:hypothetical protein